MTDLTRKEQESGVVVIKRWPKAEVLSVAAMGSHERNIVLLAAGLMNLAPGKPVSLPEQIIELP